MGFDRLGRVSFKHVHRTLDYLTNETETSPVMEALLQLTHIYRLLDKRQEFGLVSRMKVQPAHRPTRLDRHWVEVGEGVNNFIH